jgi:hypothetical protein
VTITAQLQSVIEGVRVYPYVLVTGPQRSGTRIASAILGHELGYEVVDETEIDTVDLGRLFALYQQRTNFVIQAPALSAYCHLVPGAVVFMRRPLEEIHESELRVGWPEKQALAEQVRYFRTDMPPAELKYWAWDNFQKQYYKKLRWFELDYAAMAGHPFWKEKPDRATFDWDQTRHDETRGSAS